MNLLDDHIFNDKTSKIFVIEDDIAMSSLMGMYVGRIEGYTPVIFHNAEDALASIKKEGLPRLILLDINLQDMNGLQFLKELKDLKCQQPPVIIISARDNDDDVIEALEYGAEAFIPKPFSPQVLIAKIVSILRKDIETIKKSSVFIFGEFTLFYDTATLSRKGETVNLSAKEFAVLEQLIKYENIIVPTGLIFDNVWKGNVGDVSAVAVYVQRLRKKLEIKPNQHDYIKTIFGKGYIFSKDFSKIDFTSPEIYRLYNSYHRAKNLNTESIDEVDF